MSRPVCLKRTQKPVSIGIAFKDILSLDTPVYYMMQGTRRLPAVASSGEAGIYSGLTGHVTLLPQTNEKKRLISTPLSFIHLIAK